MRGFPRHMYSRAALGAGALALRVRCRNTYAERSAGGFPASPRASELQPNTMTVSNLQKSRAFTQFPSIRQPI